jgi:type I restriction enzyme, S subunit
MSIGSRIQQHHSLSNVFERPLGELCRFVGGGTPSKENPLFWRGTIPWVSPKDMKSDVLSDSSDHISPEAIQQSAANIAPVGAVLVLVRGMGLAKELPICLLQVPCSFNQDIRALIPGESISSEYLAWVLRAHGPRILSRRDTVTHGTLKLKTNLLTSWLIPVPSKSTQKRISTLLNEQIAAVRRARAAAQTRLDAALALPGALARESLRVGPTRKHSLSDCLMEIKRGIGATWKMYPVLGATREGVAAAKEGVGKSPDRYKLVDPVTVFYNPMRILLGSIAMVDEKDATGITSPDYVVMKGIPGVLDTRWFYYWFRSADGAHLIDSLSRGAVRERILFNRLAAGKVHLPEYETQLRASEQMKAVRPIVDGIRQELRALDALPAAILRDVFTGVVQ